MCLTIRWCYWSLQNCHVAPLFAGHVAVLVPYPTWVIRDLNSEYILFGIYCQRIDARVCMVLEKAPQTVSLTKFLKSSLVFNSKRAWWDIRMSSQAAWHYPRSDDYNLKWWMRHLSAPLTVTT